MIFLLPSKSSHTRTTFFHLEIAFLMPPTRASGGADPSYHPRMGMCLRSGQSECGTSSHHWWVNGWILWGTATGTNSSIQYGGTGEGEANASFAASCCQLSDYYMGDLSEGEANTQGAWEREENREGARTSWHPLTRECSVQAVWSPRPPIHQEEFRKLSNVVSCCKDLDQLELFGKQSGTFY